MGRVLVVVSCKLAFWLYPNGDTSLIQGWNYCEAPRPVPALVVPARPEVRRRPLVRRFPARRLRVKQ